MTILITRPEPEANLLQKQLIGMHIPSIVEPLFNIKTVAEDNMAITQLLMFNKVQLIIITSVNALKILAEQSNIRTIAIITVGQATANYAKKLGYEEVITTDYDALTLVKYVIKNYNPTDGIIFYPSGQVVSHDIPLLLEKAGFNVKRIVVYSTVPKQELSENILRLINNQGISAILFFSIRTVEIFITLAIQAKIERKLNSIRAFSLSNKITEKLGKVIWNAIYTSPNPRQDDLLRLLKDKL